jgi:hypothetical protein
MRTPYLVAALSAGLREGVGHITLVSEESVVGGQGAQRASHLASIVRDADHPVVGDDYIGIRNESAVQATSNRIAPEALLLCNLRTDALPAQKRADLIARLKARVDSMSELREDCPARASRTVIVSPTLQRWLHLEGFDKLPAFQVTKAEGTGSGSRLPALFGFVALLAAVGFAIYWFSGDKPNKKPGGENATIVESPGKGQPSTPNDPHKKERDEWYTTLAEATRASTWNDLPRAVRAVSIYLEELSQQTWAQDSSRKKEAYQKLEKTLDELAAKASQQIKTSLESELKDWGNNRTAAEFSEKFSRLRTKFKEQDSLFKQIDDAYKRLYDDSSPLTRPELKKNNARAEFSKNFIALVDDKVNRLLKVEKDFKDALAWLQGLTAPDGDFDGVNFATIVSEPADQVRIQELLNQIRKIDGKVAYTLKVKVVRRGGDIPRIFNDKIESTLTYAAKRVGLTRISSDKISGEFRFALDMADLPEPGRVADVVLEVGKEQKKHQIQSLQLTLRQFETRSRENRALSGEDDEFESLLLLDLDNRGLSALLELRKKISSQQPHAAPPR